MSQPSLERIEELFHRAVSMPPEERAAFLEAESAGDPALKAAVEALLKHDQANDAATSFLTSPIVRSSASPPDADATLRSDAFDLLHPAGKFPQGISGYEILEELGRGGMGVVYKARQSGLNRLVALKMLLAIGPVRDEDLARFRIEAESLARLHHPNIVQIYEIGEHEGLPYFAMEYIDGPSLAKLTEGAPQPLQASAQVVEVLARAMAVVHQCGIIHRDLKPANILLESQGNSSAFQSNETERPGAILGLKTTEYGQPKITDFGLAKRIEGPGAATRPGVVFGTPNYMAPEQARGDITALGPWTDLYALGTILYELLTGRPPFQEASSVATLAKVLNDEPLSPKHWRRGLPRDLETICLKSLEKDPKKRYATAADLAEDLRRYQAGEPIKARPIGALERLGRWCRRQPLAAAALLTAGTLAVALLATILLYNAQLRDALAREQQLAEERREHIIKLDITIGGRELDSGDAFNALLWFSEAMRLDEDNAEHRQRILQILERIPWLLRIGSFDGDVVASRCTSKGCWLAVADSDHNVRIWDVVTEAYLGAALKHSAAVRLAEFSPDGRFLATACIDGGARLWNLDSGKSELLPVPAGNAINRFVYDASGQFLLAQSEESTVSCWEVATGKAVSPPFPTDKPGQKSVVSTDGRYVFSLDSSGQGKLWNVSEGRATGGPVQVEPGWQVAGLSRDGLLAALVDPKNSVKIVETETGKVRGAPLVHTHAVRHLDFASPGDRIVTVDADHCTRLWDLANSQFPFLTLLHQNPHDLVKFNQRGRLLAALETDDHLRVWDVSKRQPATPPLHPPGDIRQAAFSSDGDRLLLVTQDHIVELWDLSNYVNGQSQRQGGSVIHPGMNREFTSAHLTALAQALASARVDEELHLSHLDNQALLDTWRRFQDYQRR